MPITSIRRQWQNFRGWWHSRYPLFRNYFIALGLVGSFLLVFFWPYLNERVFMSLQSGEAGVLWQRFSGGTNLKYTYGEGFHLVMPWNRLFVYNVRLQQTPHKIVALCKNGLPVELEVSIRHRPQDGRLPLLHTVVGPNYLEVVVKPEIEASVRGVVSQFEPNELYTSEGYILNLILQGSLYGIGERYISLDDLLIKRVVLPTKVADSIESKLIEEQRALEFEFRVQQAKREAERRGIEAKGILSFQETVAAGGSFKDYLRFAGIQATVELAKSENAKMVIIGGADGGLPLILNMPDDLDRSSSAATRKNPLLSPKSAGLLPPPPTVDPQATATTLPPRSPQSTPSVPPPAVTTPESLRVAPAPVPEKKSGTP
jgi:regulator of protease activity HflC (stomatin/prohibitin superfamily)